MKEFTGENGATPLAEIKLREKREPTKDEEYDARMVHSGFGSPDCSCHIAPPCASCVAWCPTCKEHTYGKCPESHF